MDSRCGQSLIFDCFVLTLGWRLPICICNLDSVAKVFTAATSTYQVKRFFRRIIEVGVFSSADYFDFCFICVASTQCWGSLLYWGMFPEFLLLRFFSACKTLRINSCSPSLIIRLRRFMYGISPWRKGGTMININFSFIWKPENVLMLLLADLITWHLRVIWFLIGLPPWY